MDVKEIQKYLTSKIFGRNLFFFDTIDSTNLRAKLLIEQGESHGTVIIADEQIAGRGRMNRKWLSEPKKNLLFSVIIKPAISPDRIGIVSLYAGVAVAEAIREDLSLFPVCKWPNDLLLNGKKFCGILSESIFDNLNLIGIVVGIGINVNQLNFPEEISLTATSLKKELGKEINRCELLNSVLNKMEYYHEIIQNGYIDVIINKWVHYSTMFGKEVTVTQFDKEITGKALRLDKDGGLIISTKNGELKIIAGDVSICS